MCSDLIETHVTMIHQIGRREKAFPVLWTQSHTHTDTWFWFVMHFRFSCCAIQSVFEQVWLLLLHLALNSKHSIDYTIRSVNRSIQFVRPSFETKQNATTAVAATATSGEAGFYEKKQSSFINQSIQLSDKRQICALMLSFKRSTTQLLVWAPTSLRRQCERTFTVTPDSDIQCDIWSLMTLSAFVSVTQTKRKGGGERLKTGTSE